MDKLKVHAQISYIKSMIRIGAFIVLPNSLVGAAIMLTVAEAVGIVEELWVA